nr:hypothetical protein [Tanacetum cinerariifolium]
MMSQTTLPKSFWDYAFKTAARILNMVSTKKVEKKPYEVWHGKAPKLSYLKVWGCEALVKRDTLTKPDKLEPRSTRTRNAPDRMCLYIDVEEHELGDLGEPANYKAALSDPEFDKWQNTMNVETQSMKDNEVWDLVELPPNGKTIGRKWLFKKKTDMDGAVHTYKARLVVKGYTQTPVIDYEETFSPVAYIRAIRILIAIATFYDYEIWQMDNITSRFQQNPDDLHWNTVKNILKYLRNTKNMFLVYEGAIDSKNAKQSIFAASSAKAEYIIAFDASKEAVWVRKIIFGLGVVPIIKELISMYCDNAEAITIANESGITKGARHFCAKVQYLHEVIKYGDVKLEKVHTDDNLADPFTKALAFSKHSEHTKDIGVLPASSLMGVCIQRLFWVTREARLAFRAYSIDQVIMNGDEPVQITRDENGVETEEKFKLSKSQGASTPAEMKRMQNVPYASAVGSIMYAVRCTRPDVAFAQNITSRFQQNPGDIHWTTVKNILKYLRNTKDMFLVYVDDLKRELGVFCYTDAGYLTDVGDLKSQTGYVFILNGGNVDLKSAKQSIFATSSAEAEYIVAFDASKEVVWVRKFISGLEWFPQLKNP